MNGFVDLNNAINSHFSTEGQGQWMVPQLVKFQLLSDFTKVERQIDKSDHLETQDRYERAVLSSIRTGERSPGTIHNTFAPISGPRERVIRYDRGKSLGLGS